MAGGRKSLNEKTQRAKDQRGGENFDSLRPFDPLPLCFDGLDQAKRHWETGTAPLAYARGTV